MTHEPPYIVVIDDDADFLDLNTRMLERAGYRVRAFMTPDKALAAVQGDPPDLIMTDLMMESLNSGFAFAESVKSDERLQHVPVIVVTAMTSQRGFDFRPRNQEDLAAMNAAAFFEKPVDYSKLIEKIEHILKHRGTGNDQ